MKTFSWPELRPGAVVMAAVVAGLWLIEVVDTITGHALDGLGIRPWNLIGLLGIVPAPFLHFGFAHLAANSVLYNVLPLRAGVSWQGHLGGVIGGVLAAWMLSGQGRSPARGRR